MFLPETSRVAYAQAFLNYFRENFNALNGEEIQSFTLTRIDFAQFMFDNNIFPEDWEAVPKKEEKERWSYMRDIMNRVRTEMNKASCIGLHGEPPFEAQVMLADRKNGNITVQNLQGIAMVTYNDVGVTLQTYLRNKVKTYDRKHNFLKSPEVLDQLPEALRHRINGVDGMLKVAIAGATANLTAYLAQVDDMTEQAEAEIQLKLEFQKEAEVA